MLMTQRQIQALIRALDSNATRDTLVDAWYDGSLKAASNITEASRVYNAAYGMSYAIDTARLNGQAARAIERMEQSDSDAFIALVAEVAANCRTISDVPRYLIERMSR